MGLAPRQQVVEQELGTISSTQQSPLGLMMPTLDGREFKYGLAGASNLAIGKLTQSPAAIGANHGTIASPLSVQAAAAVGATQVSVTLGGTNTTENQYKDGYLIITDSAGAGQALRIKNHPVGASASGTQLLNLVDPVTTALTTSSKAVLMLNPYAGLLISATTIVDKFCGVPGIAVTAAYYGWFQTRGPASVLADASTWTSTISLAVTGSTATAGSVMIAALTGNAQNTGETVGYVINSIPVSAKYAGINLNIL